MFDPMRTEILRLLSRRAYTAKELSEIIGLTPPSIGHHLKALVRGELISLVLQEPESHGIMQKWYQSNAQTFVVDKEQLSTTTRRYFMPVDIERARAVSACLSILRDNIKPSTVFAENLTHQICKSLCKTARVFNGQRESDPEHVVHRLYVEALRPVID
jgi:DNA-binding transcriptional ArsR family regulator